MTVTKPSPQYPEFESLKVAKPSCSGAYSASVVVVPSLSLGRWQDVVRVSEVEVGAAVGMMVVSALGCEGRRFGRDEILGAEDGANDGADLLLPFRNTSKKPF